MENEKIKCPFCNNSNIITVNKNACVQIRGLKIEYINKCFECDLCHEQFEDEKLIDENLLSAKEEYRENLSK